MRIPDYCNGCKGKGVNCACCQHHKKYKNNVFGFIAWCQREGAYNWAINSCRAAFYNIDWRA